MNISSISSNIPLSSGGKISDKEKNRLLMIFNQKINDAANSNGEKTCLKTLEKMKSLKVKPTNATYTPIIKMYLRQNDTESAWRMVREVQHYRKPDVILYTEFLNWYMKKDNLDGVQYVLEKMRENHIEADACVYDILIRFYARRGEREIALNYFAERKAKFKPTYHAYNDLLMMYERSNDKDAVFKLYREMLEEKVEISVMTINVLIQLLVKLNNIEEAKELYLSQNVCRPKIKGACIDTHSLSLGAAYIAIMLFIESRKSKESLTVIVGKGLHSNNVPMYETRNNLIKKLGLIKKVKSCVADPNNEGILHIHLQRALHKSKAPINN